MKRIHGVLVLPGGLLAGCSPHDRAAVAPVPGLRDEAFLAGSEGSAGLMLRIGAYQGQVNLTVENRDPASPRPAVPALGRQVVARLP